MGLLAVAAVGIVMVAPRALAGVTVPEPDAPTRPALTVLTFNTYEGQADVDALATLIRDTKPDLIALPESAGRFRDKLTPLVPDTGSLRPRNGAATCKGSRQRSAATWVTSPSRWTARRDSPPSRSRVAGWAPCGSSPSTPSPPPPVPCRSGAATWRLSAAGARTRSPAR